MFKRMILLLMASMSIALWGYSFSLSAQEGGDSYSAEGEYYEDEEQGDSDECHRRCRGRRDPWKEDYFEEEQYEEVGWPGRRDDELSDWLSR